MSKFLANCGRFLQREVLSVWIVTFGFFLNILAWVIPFGRLRHPSHDPVGAARFVASYFSNDLGLRVFWNGVLSLTVVMLLLSTYEVWKLAMQGQELEND